MGKIIKVMFNPITEKLEKIIEDNKRRVREEMDPETLNTYQVVEAYDVQEEIDDQGNLRFYQPFTALKVEEVPPRLYNLEVEISPSQIGHITKMTIIKC